MSRPEILFPLFAEIETLPGVGPKAARALGSGLEIARPRDLIFTLPQAGIERRRVASIRDVVPPAHVVVEVEVGAHLPPTRRSGPLRVMVRDARTEFAVVFFHARAEGMGRILPTGQRRVIAGRVELYDGIAQIVHPDHILRPEEAASLPAFEPVYPLTAGITQKLMHKAAAAALTRAPELREWIDPHLLAREGWPAWRAALGAAHAPATPADIAPSAPARARLAYDEVLAHQLTLALARRSLRRGKGRPSVPDGSRAARVRAALPWPLTAAQERALAEIAADMAAGLRMNRLLQGDVGSGKTVVAFLALCIAVEAGGQGAMMAPTEILARQHFEALGPLAEAAGISLGLLTGRDRGAARREKLAALAEGRLSILVGTHAVFQADVHFADLRLAVVDEQHRFGV
ncbi:MAG: DEAD/DEAH box helicase, partial [Gemmobacter sp.]